MIKSQNLINACLKGLCFNIINKEKRSKAIFACVQTSKRFHEIFSLTLFSDGQDRHVWDNYDEKGVGNNKCENLRIATCSQI